MNSVDRSIVLHCLKSMIDEEVCEECPLYGITGTDHCEKDCVRLAINALEQEPVMPVMYYPQVEGITPTVVEPCTDAISRQAVLDLAKFDGRENLGSIIHAFDVEQLPPVKPAEKVGQWILYRGDVYICSKCNHTYTDLSGERYGMNFCPNCGQPKMQEADEND